MTTAPTIRDDTPGATSRDEAISRFGVTYFHGGPATSPIVEALGRHAFDPDPARARRAFPSEADAVAHVREVRRRDVEAGLSRLESLDVGRSMPLRLWLARNWMFWRAREVGLLASEAISSEARKRGEGADRSFAPSVERLPPSVRLPATVDLDTPVYVVDIRDFPDANIAVATDAVARRTVVSVDGHPAFDCVLRYELRSGLGGFSFDTTDPSARRLGHPDENVRGFLDEGSALREMERLSDNLRRAMDFDARAQGAAQSSLPPPATVPDHARPEAASATGSPRCARPGHAALPSWDPCRHVQAFLDHGTRVVRPSGVPEGESLSSRFMAWADERRPGVEDDPATGG